MFKQFGQEIVAEEEINEIEANVTEETTEDEEVNHYECFRF